MRKKIETDSESSAPVTSSRGVHPAFIISTVFITLIIITALIWRWTNIFISVDDPIELSRLTPAKVIEFGGHPTAVKIGLFIKDFQKFDMVKNDFIFNGVLWFEFDPSLISLETVEKISFEQAEVLYKSSPFTRLTNGKIFARYDVRIKFMSNLSYAQFPVDDHRLSITLVHKHITPTDMIFKSASKDFIITPDLSIYGWYKVGQDVETGYMESKLDPSDSSKNIAYPAATFIMDYGRRGNIRNTITILLPLLILFSLSLFSLILDPLKSWSSIVSISVQSITGLIAFRFVMEAMSPSVGYFMYSDCFFFLFLGMGFFVFFINVFASTIPAYLKQIIIIGLNLFLIIVMAYLLWV